ncbi:MAG: hypothetical protein IPO92_16430 [Saprospiraceae bacterium]|nr:hypothetical protein [Saprospiraceae bacterium]
MNSNSLPLLYKTIIFILIITIHYCNLSGQYVFTNYQKQDGLSNNEVFCSLQDYEGFMWFGTYNGLKI